jgi:hypothetical protein
VIRSIAFEEIHHERVEGEAELGMDVHHIGGAVSPFALSKVLESWRKSNAHLLVYR